MLYLCLSVFAAVILFSLPVYGRSCSPESLEVIWNNCTASISNESRSAVAIIKVSEPLNGTSNETIENGSGNESGSYGITGDFVDLCSHEGVQYSYSCTENYSYIESSNYVDTGKS